VRFGILTTYDTRSGEPATWGTMNMITTFINGYRAAAADRRKLIGSAGAA
jgi:hypothetical protein